LAEDGKHAPGDSWHQASIIGSQFTAHYTRHGEKIIPTIRGEAWVCGDNRLLLNPDDPFCWGISL
ncbi:proline racemase family protein, partial [Escherichia coli]|nr:proline racemase family protein [Escherichia coli]